MSGLVSPPVRPHYGSPALAGLLRGGLAALLGLGRSLNLIRVVLILVRVSFRNATFADDENPFAAPYGMQVSEYVTLRVYLFSLTSVFWYFPSFFIAGTSWNGQVRGLQPVSINGQSDGLFYAPDGSS
jgi:hypothetical protein